MGKYIMNRIFRSLLSLLAVMFLVVILVFTLMDRRQIFNKDTNITKLDATGKNNYMYQKWEQFGYLDRVDYVTEYCAIVYPGGTENEQYKSCVSKPVGEAYSLDNPDVMAFTQKYFNQGYKFYNVAETEKSGAFFFAYKDRSPFQRLWDFFSNLLVFDNKNFVKNTYGVELEETYVRLQKDPLNGMPAVVCSGCENKYLLYFDNKFPFIHQNWVSLNLGQSFPIPDGDDLLTLWTASQGASVEKDILYPKDIAEGNTDNYISSADNLHKCTYSTSIFPVDEERFLDNYVKCEKNLKEPSRMGYSFIIGIFATILTYLIGVPIGILMARNKGKLIDKIGIVYIVFIMAVPSLAYIYLFQSFGGKLGLPTNFASALTAQDRTFPLWFIYILPVISLVLPSLAGTMKWIRRYMIDHMNSDYVKFARAKGLSEGEIFNKHIFRNAMIPIVHGIPGSILGCLTGSLITEKVYSVSGLGKEFTTAIENHNNSAILALTLFFSILSITSLILGDVLMAIADPRISFATSGGRK